MRNNCLLHIITFGCPGIDFGKVGNYVNASMACTMIRTNHDVTVVLVETAEAFVDSLICNFNV